MYVFLSVSASKIAGRFRNLRKGQSEALGHYESARVCISLRHQCKGSLKLVPYLMDIKCPLQAANSVPALDNPAYLIKMPMVMGGCLGPTATTQMQLGVTNLLRCFSFVYSRHGSSWKRWHLTVTAGAACFQILSPFSRHTWLQN